MNKFSLSTDEAAVFDRIRAALETLSESSQYNVLRYTAHMMDRDVVRKGSIRAAAAVAGSTARVTSEARSNPKPSKKASARSSGYPKEFVEGPGRQVLEKREALRGSLSSPPTEEEKLALRSLSSEVRQLFRAFNEGTD
jgi:hypothetical protein